MFIFSQDMLFVTMGKILEPRGFKTIRNGRIKFARKKQIDARADQNIFKTEIITVWYR